MADDYYKVLGAQRNASVDDIADVLRQENMKWSRRANNAPKAADRAEAEQRVELLAEIKNVLTDPARKAQYDATLGGDQRGPRPQPQPEAQPNPWPEAQPNPWPEAQPNLPPRPNHSRRREVTLAGRLIRHPVWTAILVFIAIAAFAAAARHQAAGGNAALGIVCVLVALRVSGLWRRR
jgi:hypothetical protein